MKKDVTSTLCPICKGNMGDRPVIGYSIEGQPTVTCDPCRETLLNMSLEEKLGRRGKFWGRSNNPEKIRTLVHAAVLNARGIRV